MLKVIYLSLFTFIVFSSTAQVQTQVIGDSVFVHSNTGKGELILQNSTDTVHGFLFNKGAGRTEFRRVLIPVGSNKYLIGLDTLDLSVGSGNCTESISGASAICVSATTTLTSNGNAGGQWTSSDSSIASINISSGVVTGHANGNATITYKVTNVCGTFSPTFLIKVDSIPNAGTVDAAFTNVKVGSNILVTSTVPGGVWRSSHPNIASVNPTGMVTGIQAGSSIITSSFTTSCGTSAAGIVITVDSSLTAWNTTGNAGTVGGTNFIGTTDSVPINFRVNNALVGTIGTTANYNVSLGALSLPNTSTGIRNVALGGAALGHDSTGQGNNAIGYTTLYNNTTGNYNTANGWASLGYNRTGSGNTTMGAGSMNTTTGAQTFGNYNTALGFNALMDLFTGNYNIGLGALGGYQKTGASNTLYVSDSTNHMYYKLDSASGTAPNVIAKDTSGFWHVYSSPLTSPISITNQTANYTLQLTDIGKMITQTVSAANTVTVPPDSSVAFPIGSKIMVNQYGLGQVSIANGIGVVINSLDGALRLRGQYGMGTLIKVAANTWMLNGDISNTVTTFDVDAKKFLDSTGITDSTTKQAINNFVLQLKDSSLWSKFVAIYPMVGGTAGTTKWNLKDPRNSDVAYRLTFNGSPTFASTGVLFPTTSDYANSHLPDNLLGASNNNSIAYYSRTQNTISGYDIGCTDSGSPANEIAIYHSSDATNWFGLLDWGRTPASTKGLFMFSATSGDVKRYENGAVVVSKGSAPTTTFTNLPILIGKVINAGTGGQKECALAAMGQGLTDAQALTLYNIVENFQVTLGRN